MLTPSFSDGIALLQERMVGCSRLSSRKKPDGAMNRRFHRHTSNVTRHSNIFTERKQNHKSLDPLMDSTTGVNVILKYAGKAASRSSSENSSRRIALQTSSCSGRREYTKGSSHNIQITAFNKVWCLAAAMVGCGSMIGL